MHFNQLKNIYITIKFDKYIYGIIKCLTTMPNSPLNKIVEILEFRILLTLLYSF